MPGEPGVTAAGAEEVSPGVTCCPEPGPGEIWGRASAARRVPAPLPGSAQSPRSPAGSRGQMSPGQWQGHHDLAVPLSPPPCQRRGRAGEGGAMGRGRSRGVRDVWMLRARRCRQRSARPRCDIDCRGQDRTRGGLAGDRQMEHGWMHPARPGSGDGRPAPAAAAPEPLGPCPGQDEAGRAVLGCSRRTERQETAQECRGSRQPLDVSVGLTLVPVTAEKRAEKGQEGTKIWGLGDLWRAGSTDVPAGWAGIEHLAGG